MCKLSPTLAAPATIKLFVRGCALPLLVGQNVLPALLILLVTVVLHVKADLPALVSLQQLRTGERCRLVDLVDSCTRAELCTSTFMVASDDAWFVAAGTDRMFTGDLLEPHQTALL